MPLINLKTELKSLKFDTRAPYIVKDVNNPPVYNSLSDPALRRTDDVLRLTKMLSDTPGVKFVAHQTLLQSFNKVNYESNAKTLLGQVADILGNVIISTGRAATISLAQAGIEGTGIRLILPTRSNYYYTESATGASTAVNSPTVSNGRGVATIYSSRNSKYAKLAVVGDKNNEVGNIYQEDLNKHNYSTSENYLDLLEKPDSVSAPTKAGQASKLNNSITVKGEGKYHFAGTKKGDAVNTLDVGAKLEDDDDNLSVKVVFAKYGKEKNYTGTKVFRAFIGNISDAFAARWNPVEYAGRMEQFFVYTGFTRTLSFPLTVPIFSESEQITVYNKVNSLISHTAPEYNRENGIPSGVITYLEVGDYIKSPGVITNIGVSIDNNVPWSVGDEVSSGKRLVLPQVISLQVQFMPIHPRTPQYRQQTIEELKTFGQDFRYIGNGEKFSTIKNE